MEFNIKLRRGKLGLTIEQLAEKSKVGFSTISQIESGKTKNPQMKTLITLDDCLKGLETLKSSGQFYCNQDDGEYNNNPCSEQCSFCKNAESLQ